MLPEAFLNRMKEYLKDDYNAFIKSYEEPNQRALLVNRNKIANEVFDSLFPFPIAPIPYYEDGRLLNTEEKIGRNPLHHAGCFYLQDPSAMMPPLLMDVKDGEAILDLCSAPGGKTIVLANQNPHGFILANEINTLRSKILYSNCERMGLKNVLITSSDAGSLKDTIGAYFDKVLVDAPCSGEGMFRKDKQAISEWNPHLPLENSIRQKEILDNAYYLLKEYGLLVYSTCTFSREENEDNVSYLMDKYHMELIEPRAIFQEHTYPGFLPKTLRSYPFIQNGEGQFMAILKKKEETPCYLKKAKEKRETNILVDEFMKKFMKETLPYVIQNDTVFLPASNIQLKNIKVISNGVIFGNLEKGRLVPHHALFQAFGLIFKNTIDFPFDSKEIERYLRGEELESDVLGYGAILVNGVPLGGFKGTGTLLKNYYPKGLRNF